MAFSPKFLDSIQPKAKPYREFEGTQRPGFGVQVSPGGKVTFIYLYREPVANKQRVMKLGSYYGTGRDGLARDGGLTLKEAYAAYADARRIREEGRDPQIVRDETLQMEEATRRAEQERRKLEAAKGSIRQLFDAYTHDLKANQKRSWGEVSRALSANVFPIVADTTKAKDVSPGDIKAVLATMIKRDSTIAANRVRAYLSAAFSFGIHWDNDPNRHFEQLRFGITANPVRDVPKPERSETPRERHLSESEVKQLWDVLGSYQFHPKTIAAIRLLFALGGQRVEEVLGLHADDVDMQNRLVTLRDTKNGSTHVVPFGDVAAPILQGRLSDGGALFAKVKGQGIIDHYTLSHAVRKLCKRTGIEPFVPKDIRRTVKTLMGAAGIRKEDRDRFQNHALSDVSSKHYDRYDYLAEKRQVMAVWDAYLKTIFAGEPAASVVQLRAVGR